MYPVKVVCNNSGLSYGPPTLDPALNQININGNILLNQIKDREDLTASAQHALRLLSFGVMHKILGMQPPQ